MYRYFIIYISSFICLSFIMLQASDKNNSFNVESASVVYNISGGAQLTPETNLSIQGTAKLRFSDWGNIKIEEEIGLLLTSGAIKHKQHVQNFVKETKDSVITVDYRNKQLTQRKKVSHKQIIDITKNLEQKGIETVAGVECDIWEGPGERICIYKGIILKLESNVYNASYLKEATKIVLNKHTTSDDFKLPDFPIHKIGLFKDNMKTKKNQNQNHFMHVVKNGHVTKDSKLRTFKTKEQQKIEYFLNYLGKDIFREQKELLPMLLLAMKKTRECLQTVENPFEANECIEEFSRMKAHMGMQMNDYILLWDEKRKEKLLDKIEDEVTNLQSRIPCINRAKNITDLSACFK